MVKKELHDYIKLIQLRGCGEQTTEVKAAHFGCPENYTIPFLPFPIKTAGEPLFSSWMKAAGLPKSVYMMRRIFRKRLWSNVSR